MTNSSYLDFFELRGEPCSKEVDEADLWLPPTRSDLVAEILAALTGRGSVLLLGEPGVGKTCVLRALRHRVGPSSGLRLTYCRNATLGRRDFYRYLSHALSLAPTASAAQLFLQVEMHIQNLSREKLHPVFLLDEAHLLHPDMLAHLHILLNHDWDAKALLSLVLVGLPELEPKLLSKANRSLLSRIHHRFLVEPTTVEDTAAYVRHRLEQAGSAREIFTEEALTALHEASRGALRDIDRLVTAALREAARRKRKSVEKAQIEKAAEHLCQFT